MDESDFAKCKLCRKTYIRTSSFTVVVSPTTKRKSKTKGARNGICVTCASVILGDTDQWEFKLVWKGEVN